MNNVDAALEFLDKLSSSFHATKQLGSEQLQTFGQLESLETILELLGHRLNNDNPLLLQLNIILEAKIDLEHWSFTADEQHNIASVIKELKGQLILGARERNQDSPNPTIGQHIIANQGSQGLIHLDAKDNSFGDVAGSVFSHNKITFNADPAVRERVDKLVERTTGEIVCFYHILRDRICPDAQNRAFEDWVSTLDFERIQKESLSKQASGTCSWFTEELLFQSWEIMSLYRATCSTLFNWITAAGVGKTILASSIIEYLQRSVMREDIAVVYVYCDYAQRTNQTTAELLGSILKQLVHNKTAISQQLISLHQSSRNSRPSLSDLTRALETQVALYSSIYIVVDALDEFTILDNSFSSDLTAREEDLRTYIKGRIVSESRIARLLKGDTQFQEEIISQVVTKAAGMLLHVDSLASKHSRKALRASLQTLPKEINNSYDETMIRIKSQGEDDCNLALQVFMWLTYAQPLKMRELQYALAVSPEMAEMEEDAVVDVELLTAVCAGLVIVEEVSIIVRLVHYTTQQYFELEQETLFPDAHPPIAISCVQYLTFDAYSWYYSFRSFQTLLEQNPFLEYAARYWGTHSSRNEMRVRPHILAFIQNEEKVSWAVKVFVESKTSQPTQTFLNLISGAHALAMFGLHQTLEQLLDDASVAGDDLDSNGSTPLFHAAEQGHVQAVELLLGRVPSSADLPNQSGSTPLLTAAIRGRNAVVKLLVASKLVNIEGRDTAGRTALFAPAIYGPAVEFATILLEAGALINQKCNSLRTPLSYAAQYGIRALWASFYNKQPLTPMTRIVMAQLLQCEALDTNLADDSGTTPLIYAARRGDKTVYELLLDHKAINPKLRDWSGRTAVCSAICSGPTESFERRECPGSATCAKELYRHQPVLLQSRSQLGS
ncbi:hypothetical protein C8J56DRAFT_1057439 [Mycena floridula]|nr:hypothetical protein C8J56DRAFT_1057439 [Mycena floridula]